MNLIATACAGLVVTALLGHAEISGQSQTRPQTEVVDVTTVGCLKAWQPASADPTRFPEPRMGTYILTPLFGDPNKASVDLPTYLLLGGATTNFSAHLNHKVEISGVKAAPQPATSQNVVAVAVARPENTPDTRAMPSLTVQSLRMISSSCP